MAKKIHSSKALWSVLFLLMGLSVSQALAQGQGKKSRKIKITPLSARLQKDSTLQFTAKIIEVNGTETDTTFTWSVDATGFGSISSEGLFTATARGQGNVYAAAGDLTARAHVNVIDTARGDSARAVCSHLVVTPADTLLLLGESMQYRVSMVDSAGVAHDTTGTWQLRGNTVGELSETGLFTATDRGVGIIKATVGRFSATTRVIVATEADTAACDSIRIRIKDRDGVQQGNLVRVQENDIFLIKGLPFPLNVLNGGEIVFPPGSLTEGIDIEIGLSETAIVRNDSTVAYGDQILNGISFHVTVDGVVVSPYYFSTPVQLVLPYKEALLETLGLTPDDLWIFFFENATDYNGDGIANVVVDTVMNKIYADIIHFSDLVIGARSLETTAAGSETTALPLSHRLFSNYPNPFNPETKISFEVAGVQSAEAEVSVYNVRGQKIRTLLEARVEPGMHAVGWDGRDDHGAVLSSGLYFYRLRVGDATITRRMMLLK